MAATAASSQWSVSAADAASPRRKAKQTTRDPNAAFQTFCKEWMEKVWAREQQRVIEWEPDADGVHGTYVEYGRDYQCTTTTTTPVVGKINYREVWYEKRGKTVADAQASEPQPIKIFDTGEFFSYSKDKWLP